MPGSATTPGHMGTRAIASIRVAFHTADGVGSRDSTLSRLIGWPMHSPTDASPTPSREPAHGSGPMRFATPSSWRTFTTYSLPVSPAHRREFIGLLGGATAWPLAVHAQQSAIPVIGFLRPGQPPKSWIEAFQQGLRELGYVDGQNVVVEFRSTDGSVDQLPQLIDELMRRKVNVASGQLLRQRRKLPRRCPSSSWV
jgi:hypothetical protein